MGISLTMRELYKVCTYRWKVSKTFHLYITISGQSYICFGVDSTKETTLDEHDKKVIHHNEVFIINNDYFNDRFWKNIINKLPLLYKREIILKNILNP